MALAAGTRVGPYQIVSAIGAGGMGEVYRARDTNLHRDVAIKVLPTSVAADPERLARLQREAQVLASLNHPNIAIVHGLETAAGTRALVMELVEGDDLAQRIARGAIPVGEALSLAAQIAAALEAAHEQGIVHRDLKPANIKLKPRGSNPDDGADCTVKVLDFGLAKATDSAAVASDAAQSATVTTPPMTHVGMTLGTPAYMSPEQARGRPLDRRTDIWSFGCVLYEMLTGRRAFGGDGMADVLTSVLTREPDLTALPASTPQSIRRLIRRCLEKGRDERLRDIGDARIEIRDALAGGDTQQEPDTSGPAPHRSRERLAWIGALAALTAALGGSLMFVRRPVPAAPEMRVDISTPPTMAPLSQAISPDGLTIAFVATSDGKSRLWLRSLESGSTRFLTGTDSAESPFWSPDSRSIAFFAETKIKKVDVTGGSVQTLATASSASGGSWNGDGVILFAALGRPISRIPESGGEPVALTGLAQQGSNFTPEFLPDGRRFLYYVRGRPEVRGVYIGQLDETLPARRLLESDTGAVYATSGHLLFIRDGRLMAQQFDPGRLELSGSAFPIAEGLGRSRPDLGLSVSRTGSITYRMGSASARQQFAWFDRSGVKVRTVGDSWSSLSAPSLSPDGQRVVLYRGVNGNADIWILETQRGALSRVTTDAADDVFPVWSSDGGRIIFSSNRNGVHDLYRKSLAGDAIEEVVLSTAQPKFATDWSRDGRWLVFNSWDGQRSSDIWALPLDGTKQAFPIVQTQADELNAQLSPDGHWIAYQSDESERAEIYVRPFPGPGDRWPVSTGGGRQVRWGRGELFYVAPNSGLMAVRFRATANASPPEIGSPIPLFVPPLGSAVQLADYRHKYVVSLDGQQFLVAAVTEEESHSPITVILNWKPKQ